MTTKRPSNEGERALGRTPLHDACIRGDLALAEEALSLGADPSKGDGEGWTPLHFAAQSHTVAIARRLLDAGAIVDAFDVYENTPLFRAVFESRGRGELIELLLRAGADPDRENRYGVTPRSLAATIANFDVARWFRHIPKRA